jgi:hypothetical protein
VNHSVLHEALPDQFGFYYLLLVYHELRNEVLVDLAEDLVTVVEVFGYQVLHEHEVDDDDEHEDTGRDYHNVGLPRVQHRRRFSSPSLHEVLVVDTDDDLRPIEGKYILGSEVTLVVEELRQYVHNILVIVRYAFGELRIMKSGAGLNEFFQQQGLAKVGASAEVLDVDAADQLDLLSDGDVQDFLQLHTEVLVVYLFVEVLVVGTARRDRDIQVA